MKKFIFQFFIIANCLFIFSSQSDAQIISPNALAERGPADSRSRPVDELMTGIKAYVEKYGDTGYVDPALLRN